MEGEQDDPFAARRAAFDKIVDELPTAGSAAYWQRIEASGEDKLALEVLGRCIRERLQAGAREDAGRVFAALLLRIQPDVQRWARRIESAYQAIRQLDLAPDLEQQCHIAVWKELFEDGPTFLLEHFGHTLNFIELKVLDAKLVKEGLKHHGKGDPNRVPRGKTISIEEQQREHEDDLPPSQIPADSKSEEDFNRLSSLEGFFDLLKQLKKPEHRIVIYLRFFEDWTTQEIADELGLTDRAIRFRLQKAIEQLQAKVLPGKGGAA